MTDRGGLQAERKASIHTTEHTRTHARGTLLVLTRIFSPNILLEIKHENESVTLLFGEGRPAREDKAGERNQEVKGQEESRLSAPV